MGNPLFGVDISGLINANIGPGVNDATLTKVTGGTRTGGQLTGGTNPTTATYACKGFVDVLDKNRLEGTLAADTDVLVALIGDSIAGGQVPTAGDRVTIMGTEYNIIQVTVDPALAVYNCTARAN
tara:strand:+ start:13520 stop:13894 length:375 start_codon:yes stop_codon:yes gene_type:complete